MVRRLAVNEWRAQKAQGGPLSDFCRAIFILSSRNATWDFTGIGLHFRASDHRLSSSNRQQISEFISKRVACKNKIPLARINPRVYTRVMKVRGIIALALTLAQPALAAAEGKLDLAIVTPIRAPAAQKDVAPLPKELWAPGSPLFTRGESTTVQAFSYAGNATLGAMGLAENIHGFGKSRESTAIGAGFGAILGLQLFNAWKLITAPESRR